VADTGPGIAREYHERIFDKFVCLDKRSGQGLSSGLGLYFCRIAAEAQGGRIWVDSEPGHGSTFTVALPAADAGSCGV
jgi:signal transduction histidine kinase